MTQARHLIRGRAKRRLEGAVGSIAGDGYTLRRGVISPDQRTAVATALERLNDRDRVSVRRGALYGARGLLDEPVIRDLAGSGALPALARAILGPSAFPVKGTLFDKRPGANWQVGWHQDLTIAVGERRDVPGFCNWTVKAGIVHAEAPENVLAKMIALRLHIDDCGRDNGPLVVIPGSHRRGKLGPEDRDRLVESAKSAVCTVASGDVLAMRPLILHRSPPSASPSHRRVLHVEYATADLPGGLRWRT